MWRHYWKPYLLQAEVLWSLATDIIVYHGNDHVAIWYSLKSYQFYLQLTTPYRSYNYTQQLYPVVVGTAQQRKQMTNITTIYSQANQGLTMGYVK